MARAVSVAVVTPAGDLTTGALRATSRYTAVADAEHREATSEAMIASYARRKARGEKAFGRVPYGYERRRVDGLLVDVADPDAIDRVVDTYVQTGSLNATCKWLNGAGLPSRMGGKWYPQAVAKVVDREAPHLRDQRRGRGVRGDTRVRILSRLLRCHCGQIMSPTKMRKGTRWYCRAGAADAGHLRPFGITENKIMPWIVEEAARLRLPSEVEMDAPGADYDDSEQRRGLRAMRDAIGEDAFTLAMASLDAKRAEHGEHEQVVAAVPPTLDWSWTIESINEWLRAAFEYVELGDDLRPVRAEWLVPEWRKA
jgi:hypothetical protein